MGVGQLLCAAARQLNGSDVHVNDPEATHGKPCCNMRVRCKLTGQERIGV